MDASISVLSPVIACSLDGNIGGHYNMDGTARQIDTPPPGGPQPDVVFHDARRGDVTVHDAQHHDIAHHDTQHRCGGKVAKAGRFRPAVSLQEIAVC